MKNKKKKQPRITVFSIASVLTAAVFVAVLFMIQVYGAGNDGDSTSSVKSYDVTVSASRGEILDRSGNALVYNEQVNSLIFNALEFPSENEEINSVLMSLINLLESRNEEWIDTLPLLLDENGEPYFPEDRESDITK